MERCALCWLGERMLGCFCRHGPETRQRRGRRKSSAELGFSYACPAGSYGSTACKNYLAGALHFTLADYEVFVLKQ